MTQPRASKFSVPKQGHSLSRRGGFLVQFHPEVVWSQLDFQRHNQVCNRVAIQLKSNAIAARVLESKWRVVVQPGTEAGGVFLITFKCLAGNLKQARLGVELHCPNWSVDNYVLLPAAAYRGNRFLSRKIPYSPKLYFVQDIGADKPVIITDVPRLNIGEGVSRIQERSGSLATPAIGFHDPKRNKGFLLLTLQGNELGDYGIGIEENRRRDRATISLTSPVVRELHSYRICDSEFPSLDEPRDFKAGDEVTFRFRVFDFPAPKLQTLFDKFAAVRKDFVGEAKKKSALPYSACFALQEKKFNRDNFVPKHGYYSVGPRQNFLQDWQIGWTGGMISTYPLLFAGNAATRKNVLRNFDWLFPNGLAPSGFFWDSGDEYNQN